MAGRLFTGITSGLTQGITKGLFTKQEEPDDSGFQDLLSHLQPKSQNIHVSSISNDLSKSQTQSKNVKPTPSSLKIEEEDLIADQTEGGWGIADDDLIIDQIEQPHEEDKRTEVALKTVVRENKSKTPERKPSTPTRESGKNTKALFDSMNEKTQDNSSSRRKIGLPFKQMRDKASDITKNMAGSLIGKISKGDTNTEEKPKKGGESAGKTHEGFDFKDVFSRLVEPIVEHPKKVENEGRKEIHTTHGHHGHSHGHEDSNKLKKQMQKYMAQANQLEILVKEEREFLYDEHAKKLKEVEEMRKEALTRLEECEKREKEVRAIEGKIFIKEHLNVDENYLEKLATEREENQGRINDLEAKTQFLELNLKNEQEKSQREMEETLTRVQQENQRLFNEREVHLKSEYEELLQRKSQQYHTEILHEKIKYSRLAEKAKGFASSFRMFKESVNDSLQSIAELLWVKGEEYNNSSQIMKEFHEKVTQMNYGLKIKLDQKEHLVKKHQEIEKGLKEEIEELEVEKSKAISTKEKEIKELKNKFNKLEEGFEIEKGNLLMIQTKLDEVSMKLQNSEQKSKALEKEKNELKKSMDSEKKSSSNLQGKVEDLTKREKEHEETIKSLEKSKAELEKSLREEKKKLNVLQAKYDDETTKDQERTQTNSELEKKKIELERSLENEKSKYLALQLTLEEVNRNGTNDDLRLKALEKEKEDMEERYENELKELKTKNYKTEETYMKEIDDLKREIDRLKAPTPPKESKSIWRKSSNAEHQKKIAELTEQIEHLNTEKIHLAEKYKKDKNELVAQYDERFKSLNTYIEQLYGKNHELTEEKKKTTLKLSQMREKLITLDNNLKDVTSHHQETFQKQEIKELLEHLSVLSGNEVPHENVIHKEEKPAQEKNHQVKTQEPEPKEKEVSVESPKKEVNISREERERTWNRPQIETEVKYEALDEEFNNNSPSPTKENQKTTPNKDAGVEHKDNKSDVKGERTSSPLNDEKKEESKKKSPLFAGLSSWGGKIASAITVIPSGLKGVINETEHKSKESSKSAGLPESLTESPDFGQRKNKPFEIRKSIEEKNKVSSIQEKEEEEIPNKESAEQEINVEGGWDMDNLDADLGLDTQQKSPLKETLKESEPQKSQEFMPEIRVSLLPPGERRENGIKKSQEKLSFLKRESQQSSPQKENPWNLDVEIQPEMSKQSPELKKSKELFSPEKPKLSTENLDLGIKDEGWGFNIETENISKQQEVSSPNKQWGKVKVPSVKSSVEKKKSPEIKSATKQQENLLNPELQVDVSAPWDTDINFDEVNITSNKSAEKPKSSTETLKIQPGGFSFGTSPGKPETNWNLADDVLNIKNEVSSDELKTQKPTSASKVKQVEVVPEKSSSPSAKENLKKEDNVSKESQDLAGSLGSSKKLSPTTISKTSLETPVKKSTEKSSTSKAFDFAAKPQTTTSKPETEEKKKGGLVINKILLPKKGAATTNKISLAKKNEEKADIDLEEFLGSSLK